MYKTPVLIDTQIIIWLEQDFERIPKKIIEQITGSAEVYFSMVSVWEIAIKLATGKLKIGKELNMFIDAFALDYNFSIMNIDLQHIYHTQTLPHFHKDPFDRLIAAQCLVHDIPLISSDAIFDDYKVNRLWQ